jgi:hypothetical protein
MCSSTVIDGDKVNAQHSGTEGTVLTRGSR